MKQKMILRAATVAFVLAVIYAPSAFAIPELNFGSELNAAKCGGGSLVINVVQNVLNGVDSGTAGNNWAFDNYHRTIQVWQNGNSFCAIVRYEGTFLTVAGPSPGNTVTLTGGFTGQFEGGYRSTVFTGTLLTSPSQPTSGFIGTFDYKCNISGNCPGFQNWRTFYFSSTTGFDLQWWGWIYHGGQCGTWVNSISGNSGDIVC